MFATPPSQAANSETIKSMALLLGLLQLLIRWRRNDCTRLIKSGGESLSVSMLGTQQQLLKWHWLL